MNKDFLIESARRLAKVSDVTIEEINIKFDTLVGQLNEFMLKYPDISKITGNNLEMMKDNHSNHLRFMISIFYHFNAEILVETILWVFRTYKSHGFSPIYWSIQLNAWLEVYKNNLSTNAFEEIKPYYVWMQVNIPIFDKISSEYVN